jgi:hypothetical protein
MWHNAYECLWMDNYSKTAKNIGIYNWSKTSIHKEFTNINIVSSQLYVAFYEAVLILELQIMYTYENINKNNIVK